MASAFPVRFPDQLRQHLRALRKGRSLTQAQLGALVGVSQARIAEIEANPGLVNFEQLMNLLSVLGVTLTLHEGASTPAPTSGPEVHVSAPKTSRTQPKVSARQPKGEPSSTTPLNRLHALNPEMDVQPTSRRNFVVRPKKGSW